MNVEIGTEAAQFPEKEYINGIFLAVRWSVYHNFARDGRQSERGRACIPHPHQAGRILPSWWNVGQKVAIATLCVRTPWCKLK